MRPRRFMPEFDRPAQRLALWVSCLVLALSACTDSTGGDPVENAPQNEGTTNQTENNASSEYEVSITAPEEGEYETNTRLLVEGTAQGVDKVEVNGESTEVDEGVWEIWLTFENGEATVTAVAEDVEDTVDFFVDSLRPVVAVETPERGTVIDADDSPDDTVVVAGQLIDAGPSGLLFLEVNGQFVDVDEDGYFEAEIPLSVGLNRLSFNATDRAHNEGLQYRSVIYGPLADPRDPIESAAGADISAPSGTDAIADVIEAYITPEQIEAFVASGFDAEGAPVDISTIDWSDLVVELVPHDGYLILDLVMSDLFVEGEFDFGDEPTVGSLAVTEIEVSLELALSVDQDQQLDLEVLRESIELGEITVNIAGQDQAWAEPVVALVVIYAFNNFLAELIEENLWDPDVLVQEVEFLDRTLEITLILEDILISSRGISAVLGVEFPGEKYPDVPDVPGALHRPLGDPLGGSIDRDILFHSTRTTFDRIFHGLWYSGLFHQQVANEMLADADVPFELTASGIGILLDDRITDIHGPDTPVELHLRPLLSPVAEFGADDSVTVQMGDFLIDFVLVPDEGSIKETLFLTVALQLDLDVDFDIGTDGVDFDIGVDAVADVIAEPEIDFNHEETTEFITDLLTLIPQLAASDLSLDADTALEWATISDPEIEIHGSEHTRISIGLDLEPAQDFIDEDDVDTE